jgi:endonuclease YncB( thermonuclease family)
MKNKPTESIIIDKVAYGDTFVSEKNTYRLIGVDTPESVAPQEYR